MIYGDHHISGTLDQTFKESEKLKISHRIRLDGMVATEISKNGHNIISGHRVIPGNDSMFGDYCSFIIQIDVRWYNCMTGRCASVKDRLEDIHCLTKGRIMYVDFGGHRIVEKFSDYLYNSDTRCIVFSGQDDGYGCFSQCMYFPDATDQPMIVPSNDDRMRCSLICSYLWSLPKTNNKKVPLDNTKNDTMIAEHQPMCFL